MAATPLDECVSLLETVFTLSNASQLLGHLWELPGPINGVCSWVPKEEVRIV